MKVKITSEISYQDAKNQALKFIFDNNFEEVDRTSKIDVMSGFNNYIIELTYKDNFESITDVVAQLQFNILNNQN